MIKMNTNSLGIPWACYCRMLALAVYELAFYEWVDQKTKTNVLVNRKIFWKSKQLKTINKAVELVRAYWLLNEFYRSWTRLSPFVLVSPLVVVFRWQQCVEFNNRAAVFLSIRYLSPPHWMWSALNETLP